MITLLTDFGFSDSYVGVMKGVISSICPKAKVVDICHEVAPQSVEEAAFLLMTSYAYFPRGAIHCVVVDPGVGSARKIVLVHTRRYFFLAPDNGVLSWALSKEDVTDIYQVTNDRFFLKPVSRTFHGRDIFAPVAASLESGIQPEKFGKLVTHIHRISFPEVKLKPGALLGQVIYVDRFGNLITNIHESYVRKLKHKGAIVGVKGKKAPVVFHSYSSVRQGALSALVGSTGFLEIAKNQGSAARSLNAGRGTRVEVKIEDFKMKNVGERRKAIGVS